MCCRLLTPAHPHHNAHHDEHDDDVDDKVDGNKDDDDEGEGVFSVETDHFITYWELNFNQLHQSLPHL